MTVVEVLNLLLEDSKARLTNIGPERFQIIQGEAQAYEKLLRKIQRPLSEI